MPNVTALLDRLGVRIDAIKSGPLKAVPNPFEPLTPEAREVAAGVIRDMYETFLGMVVDRRHIERDRARTIADGRIYTGRQARDLGLIDALGGEEEARAWLATRGVSQDLRVRRLEIERDDGILGSMVSTAVRAVIGKTYLIERLTLDGPVALWHPSGRVQ